MTCFKAKENEYSELQEKKRNPSSELSHNSSIRYYASDFHNRHNGNGEKWSTKPPFFSPHLFFFLKKTAQTIKIPYNMTLVREGQNTRPKRILFRIQRHYHSGPTTACSHKDHCTILSVDTAAR